MHGMPPKKSRKSAAKSLPDAAPAAPLNVYAQHAEYRKRHSLYPTTQFLRRGAPKNVPFFSYEYGDTGAGADVGIAHNWAAFDNIKVVPRYGTIVSPPPVDVTLFGQRYSAPVGIAPMGGPSLVWPGADLLMAQAAPVSYTHLTLPTILRV